MKLYAALLITLLAFAGTATAQIQGIKAESGPGWNRYYDANTHETVSVDAPWSLYTDFTAVTIADVTGDTGLVFTRLDVTEASATVVVASDWGQFSPGEVNDDDCDLASPLVLYASRNCAMEARVMFDAGLIAFNIGLSDAQYEAADKLAVTAAFTTPTLESTASDCAVFVYDANISDVSYIGCVAVKADTDGTWNETTVNFGANDWHIYRVECNSDGDVDFWLDGDHVGSESTGITATDPLCAYLSVQSRTAGTSYPMYVDYIRAWQGGAR